MFSGLIWHFREAPLWVVLVFLTNTASQIVSYARARAEGLGFSGDQGFFQRAERMIVLSIGSCLGPLLELVVPGSQPRVIRVTCALLAAGAVWTAFERSRAIFQMMKASEEGMR